MTAQAVRIAAADLPDIARTGPAGPPNDLQAHAENRDAARITAPFIRGQDHRSPSGPAGTVKTKGRSPALRTGAVLVSLLAPLVMALAPARADRAIIEGQAHVIDADTIDIGGTSIRLWGIDAPERDQTCVLGRLVYDCGQLAADELEAFLNGRTVRCRNRTTDRYGRIVGVCHVSAERAGTAGRDIAAWLVENGLAFDWPRYSGGHYQSRQDTARRTPAGLWLGTFEWPWQWRGT